MVFLGEDTGEAAQYRRIEPGETIFALRQSRRCAGFLPRFIIENGNVKKNDGILVDEEGNVHFKAKVAQCEDVVDISVFGDNYCMLRRDRAGTLCSNMNVLNGMGSVDAMEKMGDYFQAKADADNSDSFYQCAAYFWRVRAYQYGSAAAKQYLIDWCQEHPDSRMISPGLDEKLNGVADGELLNALGFTFFQEDREYSLSGVDAQGVVEVSSWESDEGPDEDGFGMEECYDWWYLNEYLMLPEGVGYIHSYSHNDKRCNEKKFLALHDQVAGMSANRTR